MSKARTRAAALDEYRRMVATAKFPEVAARRAGEILGPFVPSGELIHYAAEARRAARKNAAATWGRTP